MKRLLKPLRLPISPSRHVWWVLEELNHLPPLCLLMATGLQPAAESNTQIGRGGGTRTPKGTGSEPASSAIRNEPTPPHERRPTILNCQKKKNPGLLTRGSGGSGWLVQLDQQAPSPVSQIGRGE